MTFSKIESGKVKIEVLGGQNEVFWIVSKNKKAKIYYGRRAVRTAETGARDGRAGQAVGTDRRAGQAGRTSRMDGWDGDQYGHWEIFMDKEMGRHRGLDRGAADICLTLKKSNVS